MISYDHEQMRSHADSLAMLAYDLHTLLADFHEDAARSLGAAHGPETLASGLRANQVTDDCIQQLAMAVRELAQNVQNMSEAAQQGDEASSRNIDVASLKSGRRAVV